MRPIDADALKEFINECKVCDICPNKALNCVIHCDFPDYLTPIWEKVIDSIPTIEDLSEYSDKLWKKAYERGKAEDRPQGEWIDIYSSHIAYMCSNCGLQTPICDYYHFCPNCGTEMTKEAENDTSVL